MGSKGHGASPVSPQEARLDTKPAEREYRDAAAFRQMAGVGFRQALCNGLLYTIGSLLIWPSAAVVNASSNFAMPKVQRFHNSFDNMEGETQSRRSSDSAALRVHTGCTPAAKSA